MRPLIAIVFVCFCRVIPVWCAEPQVVPVEIFSGVYFDMPGDWRIAETGSGKVLGTATALAGKPAPAPVSDFERLIYPVEKGFPALLFFSAWLQSPAEAEATRKDFESGTPPARLLKLAEAGVSGKMGGHEFTLKSPVRVERVTISGQPAFTTHAVGQCPHQPDITDDGILLFAGNTVLIGITAKKKGNAPDAWAQMDRVRASLRLDASAPRIRKLWESARPSATTPTTAPSSAPKVDLESIWPKPPPPSTAPSLAQKEADATVWGLFSGLGKAAPQAAPAAEAWQSSWDAFARDVQAMYSRKATREEFIKRFNGKRVEWEGELEFLAMIEMTGKDGGMPFAMPMHMIRLPDGHDYRMWLLMVDLPRGVQYPVDKKLRFRATLSDGADPAVSAVATPDGKSREISLKTAGLAELLK